MSTLEATRVLDTDTRAKFIVEQWDEKKGQRSSWEEEKQELRNYIFATDTSKTSNNVLPWKNSTTLPKICQVRDNLHANYISALFPNDNWMKWEGYSADDETKEKKEAIQAYMSNKTREDNMRATVSRLVYDYIDYGIAIPDVVWVNETKEDPETGETIAGYVGPRLIRFSPLDVIFDPTADTFESSWKITRSLKRFGELKLAYKDLQEDYIKEAIKRAEDARAHLSSWSRDDFKKSAAFSVDGFGDYYTYLGSGFVEVLEFEGTMHDPKTGELLDDYIITVIDRTTILRQEKFPAWKRNGYKVMTGWRKRPDNLYAMGPLDNLVGMQYRLDHLQNATADARDLLIMPPLLVRGEIQNEPEWAPFAQFQMEVDGDVKPLFTGSNIAAMEQEIAFLMQMMEEMAGAPKQAMGIRTPGEKTAHEVSELANAAGRIFQEKVTQFETELLEPSLNNMLEVSVRNMQVADVIRTLDDDFGVPEFMSITKEDITAKGKLRPVGARHFAQQAQLMQNLTGLANSAVWAKIEPHISDKALARLTEDLLQLSRFDIYGDNAGMMDKLDSQRLMNAGQENLETEAITPVEGE
jgi:hypothetical protein